MTVIDRFTSKRVRGDGLRAEEPVDTVETVDRFEVTRVEMWTVIRVAVVFWTLAGAVCFGAVLVVWAILSGSGQISRFDRFVEGATGLTHFQVMSSAVLGAIGLAMLVLVLIAIVLTVVAAAFYNSFASLIGGVELRLRAR
jgi:hypothetical protein